MINKFTLIQYFHDQTHSLRVVDGHCHHGIVVTAELCYQRLHTMVNHQVSIDSLLNCNLEIVFPVQHDHGVVVGRTSYVHQARSKGVHFKNGLQSQINQITHQK